MIVYLLLLMVQARAFELVKVHYTTPTKLLAASEVPAFTDDLDLAGLEIAAGKQLANFRLRNLNGTIELGGKNYPLSQAVTSLQLFLRLTAAHETCLTSQTKADCEIALNAAIKQQFNVFVPSLVVGDPRFGGTENAFFTAYATQPLDGTLRADAAHPHGVYGMPASAALVKSTRDAIDFHGALEGKGLGLLYTANLFDLYLLSIEGGGYVTLDDNGTAKNYYLNYDGNNHQPWHWISQYMMSKGYINNLTIPAQRKFLREHPEKQEEIYAQCPSYVYYRVTQSPPKGSEGVEVTAGRTLATDDKLYAFKGLLAFVQSTKAADTGNYNLEQENLTLVPKAPFARFFVDQDTGGAITGKGRADLYMGLDAYAQYVATYQQDTGNLYFLMAK